MRSLVAIFYSPCRNLTALYWLMISLRKFLECLIHLKSITVGWLKDTRESITLSLPLLEPMSCKLYL